MRVMFQKENIRTIVLKKKQIRNLTALEEWTTRNDIKIECESSNIKQNLRDSPSLNLNVLNTHNVYQFPNKDAANVTNHGVYL